jgi:NAD-dependent SIR2 family protein deacetylase
MAIGKYVTCKCKRCGYKFTRFKSDTEIMMCFERCPICGGKAEIVKTSSYPPTPFQRLIDLIAIIINRKK